ncbi:MAG: hypothetical protein ABIH82_04885 [Candidatus Woesearchaeota archaeon]
MEYTLKPSQFFLEQCSELSDKAARIVEDKLKLLKINPFRNKKLEGYPLFLFRIRFEDNQKEKRVVYLVDKPEVKILCIIDRDSGYKKLRTFLKNNNYL